MKQLRYYMMILSALLVLGSCSDDDDTAVGGAGAQISLSADVLQVPATGGSVSVTVTSDADWRLAGVCDWAHPSITEGRSGEEVTFTIDANTTGGDLSTTFKFFTDASVAPLTIKSVQGETFDLSSDEAMKVSKEGGSIYIKLKGSISDLKAECSEGSSEWLTVGEQVEFGGEHVLPLTVSANSSYLTRTATVTVSSPLTDKTVKVSIDQAPTEYLQVSLDELEDDQVIYDMAERAIQFNVVTNMELKATVAADGAWISEPRINKQETAENGLSTYLVDCNLQGTTVTRVGSVLFEAGNQKRSISIVQKDPAAELVQISSDFADELQEKGWITRMGRGYVVLEAGRNATIFDVAATVKDLTGIENFPNLETLRFRCSAYNLPVLDISGLHKVKNLEITNASSVKCFNFGDNPITSFSVADVLYTSSVSSMQFISEKLEYLNANQVYTWGNTETLDVTQCPALKTLVADRCYFLETIIVREGQAIDITKPDNVNIEYR